MALSQIHIWCDFHPRRMRNEWKYFLTQLSREGGSTHGRIVTLKYAWLPVCSIAHQLEKNNMWQKYEGLGLTGFYKKIMVCINPVRLKKSKSLESFMIYHLFSHQLVEPHDCDFFNLPGSFYFRWKPLRPKPSHFCHILFCFWLVW